LLKRLIFSDEDIVVWKQEAGEYVEDMSVSDFILLLNRQLMKYGFAIVRITDTGDIDWYAMLPTSLLMQLFPDAKNPIEARRFFHLCVRCYDRKCKLSKKEEEILQKYCKDVIEIIQTLLY